MAAPPKREPQVPKSLLVAEEGPPRRSSQLITFPLALELPFQFAQLSIRFERGAPRVPSALGHLNKFPRRIRSLD